MKKILVLVLILLMISMPVFADGMATGLLLGLLFGGLGAAGWALNPGGPGEYLGYGGIVLGGICIITGLVMGIVDLTAEGEAPKDGLYLANAEREASTGDLSLVSQSGTASLKTKDSIFNHLLLGTDGRNIYLGVRFSW